MKHKRIPVRTIDDRFEAVPNNEGHYDEEWIVYPRRSEDRHPLAGTSYDTFDEAVEAVRKARETEQ